MVALGIDGRKIAVTAFTAENAAWRATTKTFFTAEDAKDAEVTKVVDVY